MLKGLGCFKFSTQGFSIVILCHGQEEGRDFYAFVAIEPHNFRTFKNRYNPGTASNFRAYGFELVRGWGTVPPQDVIDQLLEKYGIQFGVSENFINNMIANISPIPASLGGEYLSSTAATAQG